MEAVRSSWTLESRLYPPFLRPSTGIGGLYLTGHLGRMRISADEIWSDRLSRSIPGSRFDEAMWTGGYGVGFSVLGGFVEWRREAGFTMLEVQETPTSVIEVPIGSTTFRWGFSVEI